MSFCIFHLLFLFLNYLFLFLNSTINLLITLLAVMLITSYYMSIYSTWIAYMLMLTMISGLLVLFAYMVSLSLTSQFKYKNIFIKKNIFYIFLMMSMFLYILYNIPINPTFYTMSETWLQHFFMNSMSLYTILYSIFYIFMTLLMVMEIISNSKSTMRSYI